MAMTPFGSRIVRETSLLYPVRRRSDSGAFDRRSWRLVLCKLSPAEQFGPQLSPSFFVHSEDVDCGPTGGRESRNSAAFEGEVFRPCVVARVEECDESAPLGVDSAQVWTLVKVASGATEGKVLERVVPSVLPGDDVLYVMRELGMILMKEAVFAATTGPSPYKCPSRGIHRQTPRLAESMRRAFDLKIAMKSAASTYP